MKHVYAQVIVCASKTEWLNVKRIRVLAPADNSIKEQPVLSAKRDIL